jgi:tetratricopeptide (TPR) repeat protein
MRVFSAMALSVAILIAPPALSRAETPKQTEPASHAQVADASSRCHADEATSDDRIAACTAVIAAGAAAPKDLAAAFFARGNAYREKADWDFEAYLAEGMYEDRAIADYDEALRLDPSHVHALLNRGAVNTRMRRYDRAVADFTSAIGLDPTAPAAFYGRALALRYLGQYERAVTDYRKALTLKLDDASRQEIARILKRIGPAGRAPTPAAAAKR